MEVITNVEALVGIRAARRAFPALLRLVGVWILAASAWGQISLVHVTTCGPASFPGTTCTIPVTASGNLLVVAWESNFSGGATTIASVTDNANNTYSQTGARSFDASPNTMADIWYAKNSKSGATVLTVTPNPAGTTGTVAVWEFSGVDTVSPLDQISVLNSQASASIAAGAPVTTSSAAEVVVSIVNVQGTVAGMASGNAFTNDSTVNGNGWAHMIGSSAGTYGAQWMQSPSGTYSSSSVSFKAASTGGGALNSCDLTSDGTVNSADVNLAVNMVLGTTPCSANIQAPGVCDTVTVQRVVNAALGGTCVTGSGISGSTSHSVTLTWVASTSSTAAGYNIYRATTSGGPYTKLNSSPVSALTYVDSTVQGGQTYYYVATATDSSNKESVYSTQAQAAVPLP